MITIVCPTMWNFSPFLDFISDISKMEIISKIIIINNDKDKTPTHHPILTNPKILMVCFGTNIFVNPAWNLGVGLSDTELVCIMNDDLIFDIRLFYKVLSLKDNNLGAIGLSSGNTNWGQVPITTGEIELIPHRSGDYCIGFGELMFVQKSKWVNIPDGLDISHGDNFIFDSHYFRNMQNYFISNMLHYHAGSQTVRKINTVERFEKEKQIYKNVATKMFGVR